MFIKKKLISKIEEKKIFKITFTNKNNYSLSFFNFGGYIDSIKIPYHKNTSEFEDVLLGYKNFEGYLNDENYMNCIVGRVCGRISNAGFYLDGKKYKLFPNDGGHHLHGGKKGFNKKIWEITNINESVDCLKCVFKYISPHLEEGYPGQLQCQVAYSLTNDNAFIIDFEAISDQNTIISLTNHNYWNFHGHHSNYQNIEDHFIQIKSELYCETDEHLIPTGKLLDVKNTKLDFLNLKIIDKYILQDNGIDACYSAGIENFFLDDINLNQRRIPQLATIYSNLTKMGIDLFSTKPGLQFYTGNMMSEQYKGKYNKTYGYQYGLCLEPQYFPNFINCNNFNMPILMKNKKYSHRIIMQLRNDFK